MVGTLTSIYHGEESLPIQRICASVAAALRELVGGRITQVLPSLENIFLEGLKPSGSFLENIGQFLAARQFLDRPIAISAWAGPGA